MPITVVFDYITWLYSGGVKEYLKAWANYHWFLFHFFSVDILARTFFAPWHRMREKGGRGLDIEGFLARAAVNLILRAVGVVIRLMFIIAALVSEIILFTAALLVFVIFISSPVVVPLLILSGIILIVS